MALGTALMPRLGVKVLMSISFFGAAIGLLLTSQLGAHSSYVGGVLPGMVVLAVFSGICFPTSLNAALHEVTGQDSSLASGIQGSTQQIGGAIGLSCLVTLALRHAIGQVAHGVAPSVAATHGYVLAFRIGAVLLAIGRVLVLVLLERVSTSMRQAGAEDLPESASGAEEVPEPAPAAA
jgi:MFS family permease